MASIADIITGAAQRYGVDPNALLGIAQVESNFNPAAQNPRSSAGGLFQFTNGTAQQYGLADRFDPTQAADAAARLARDNSQFLQSRLGRPVTAADLYLAHQQGAGGAFKILSNPNAPLASLVGDAAANLNGGAGLTAGQFAQKWGSKFGGAPGQPEAAPTVAQVAPGPTAMPTPQQGGLAQMFAPAVLAPSPWSVAFASLGQQQQKRRTEQDTQAAEQARRRALFA